MQQPTISMDAKVPERMQPDKAARAKEPQQKNWVRPYLKRYGALLIAAIALSALTFVFAAGLMFTSGYMISLAAALPLTVLVLHLPSIFVRIFGIGKPLLGYAERLISHDWVLRMTSEMRRALYDALERKSFALRSKESLGGILTLLTEDIGHVQDLFLKSVIPLATSWLVALLLLIGAGLFSLQLALLYLVVLAVIVVIMPAFSVLRNAARRMREAQLEEQLYIKMADDAEGLADWVLSGNFEGFAERAIELKAQQRRIEAQIRRYGRRHDLLAQAIFAASISVLAIWASFVFGAMPSDAGAGLSTGLAEALRSIGSENSPAYAPNWIAAFVLCFFPLIEAFTPVSHAAMETRTRIGALHRIEDFANEEPDGSGAADRPSDRPAKDRTPAVRGENRIPDAEPDIEIEALSFSYPESDREALNDIDLRIPYGEHVAILGKSGAGKTTLAAILHGDYRPTNGKCAIGGIEPKDIGEAIPETVGIVSQDPYIFNLTLRDNLMLANPKATDSQLIEALIAVGLKERFEKLPHGLDSIIDSHGMNLSGGEAHRIAVARILLAEQPIVVLDEPFAGLDLKTERAVLDTILSALGDRTIITITHHLENIELFDRVIFIEDRAEGSSIAFCGTPAELAADERYGKLLEMSSLSRFKAIASSFK